MSFTSWAYCKHDRDDGTASYLAISIGPRVGTFFIEEIIEALAYGCDLDANGYTFVLSSVRVVVGAQSGLGLAASNV